MAPAPETEAAGDREKRPSKGRERDEEGRSKLTPLCRNEDEDARRCLSEPAVAGEEGKAEEETLAVPKRLVGRLGVEGVRERARLKKEVIVEDPPAAAEGVPRPAGREYGCCCW